MHRTILMGAAQTEGYIDMILDRPFIFAIMKKDIPVFIGIVNNPAAK